MCLASLQDTNSVYNNSSCLALRFLIAAPTLYGSSLARGWNWAAAVGFLTACTTAGTPKLIFILSVLSRIHCPQGGQFRMLGRGAGMEVSSSSLTSGPRRFPPLRNMHLKWPCSYFNCLSYFPSYAYKQNIYWMLFKFVGGNWYCWNVFNYYLEYFRLRFCQFSHKIITKNAVLIFYCYFSLPFQISKSFHYIPTNKQTTVIFIEWDEFPQGGSPEFYFVKYQLVNNFAQKVRHLFFSCSD